MSAAMSILVAILSLHPGGPRREQQAGWEEVLVSRGVARPLLMSHLGQQTFPEVSWQKSSQGSRDGKEMREHPCDSQAHEGPWFQAVE